MHVVRVCDRRLPLRLVASQGVVEVTPPMLVLPVATGQTECDISLDLRCFYAPPASNEPMRRTTTSAEIS